MTKRSLRHIVVLFATFPVIDSFLPRHFTRIDVAVLTAGAKKDEDDDEIDVSNQDWRAFRAKLVMGASTRSGASVTKRKVEEENDLDGIGSLFNSDDALDIMTPLDPSQWAYDSGKVIETGAVILGGVEQDYGFGLRQQYFHKAAILVLDHDEHTFTKGIILNRPSDLTLDDAINPGLRWRVWFGGDVQGWTSDRPEIICLHTLNNTAVQRVSIPIINDIQWTSLDAAQRLVKAGLAKPTDFWVFCGYAGWGPQQLMGELERKSWYMVATDSQTLLKELARLSAHADPRDAGLETWSLLMSMIGRTETAQEHTGDFDDFMLKEWARQNLLSVVAGGGVDSSNFAVLSSQPAATTSPFDQILRRVSATSSLAQSTITAGTLLRAAPTERSPFLLQGQEFHKSLILILSDDENLTVGVILNRPIAKGLDVRVQEKESGQAKKQLKVPLRYGGPFAVKGSEPLVWLHCNPALKLAQIGAPLGGSSTSNTDDSGIWKCAAQDLIAAVGTGVATPEDFMVVAGVSVWPKGGRVAPTGTPGDARAFEPVAGSQIPALWAELVQQEVLTEENLNKNLIFADRAWNLGGTTNALTSKDVKMKKNDILPMGGLGEGYDEEDDDYVFQTDVKVSKLSDDALRSWVATFLLGAPSLGE
jgi:putative AlgH/UPF0301 family transcriptional regulator